MTAYLLVIGALHANYGVITDNAVQLRSNKGQWAVVVLIYLHGQLFMVVGRCE